MKKSLLLTLMCCLLLCLFTLSISAVSGSTSDEFGQVTYVDGVNENTTIQDKTSRVVLLNSDGTYTTYPAYYISDVKLQWQGTVQYKFDMLNSALGTSYSMDSIVRLEILADSTKMNQNGGSFQNLKNLKEVAFPQNTKITEIGGQQFKASSLEKIQLPSTLTTIGALLFESCTSLKEVTFAEGFSIKDLPGQMFAGCSSIEKVTLPDCVESAGVAFFSGCSSLKELRLGSSFKSFGKQSFARCNGNLVIYAPHTFLENVDTLNTGYFSYDSGDLHGVTLFFGGNSEKAQALVDKASHRGLKNAVLVEWDASLPDSYYIPESPTVWTIVYSYNMCSHIWSETNEVKVNSYLEQVQIGKICEKCQTVDVVDVISPIFTYLGVSTTEKPTSSGLYSITAGYKIDLTAYEKYLEYDELEYGVVVSLTTDDPLSVEGGDVVPKDAQKTVEMKQNKLAHNFIEIKLKGITVEMEGIKVLMCLYAFDGDEIYYLSEALTLK